MKKKYWLWIGSAFHAVLLIVLTLFALSIPDTLEDDVMLVQFTSIFRKFILKDTQKPDRDRFLFVNIAWDKEFIPKYDEDSFQVGMQTITDRKKLGQFVKILNDYPHHKIALLDIFFSDTSANDSLLKVELAKSKKCLISYHKDKTDKAIYPIFKANYSLSDMESDRPMILKYKLVQGDSLKTTPLIMYENVYKARYHKGLLFDWLDDKPILNAFILDYRIRAYNILKENEYNIVYLGELLKFPPEFIAELTKDRIVLVGDYEDRDLHRTVYGIMSGTLILLNAFLALEAGDNQISVGLILFLFVGFWIASAKAFMVRDPVTRFIEKKLGSEHFMVELFLDTTFFLVYMVVMSLTSYFLFNIHIGVLFLSFYLYAIELIATFVLEWKEKKAQKMLLEDENKTEENS